MKADERGSADGITGVRGAADFCVASFIAIIWRPRWSAERISGLTIESGRTGDDEKSEVSG